MWDYPRPPAVVPSAERVRVLHGGRLVAESRRSFRVLETSQPPAYYLPADDVDLSLLQRSSRRTMCEWKGVATYWDLVTDDGGRVPEVAWSYDDPARGYRAIAGHLAFYAQLLECWVDDEHVVPNPGMFYGGWITSRVVGPFKGAAGTLHW